MSSPIAPPLSKKAIEKCTNDVRKTVKCNSVYFDVVAFIELVLPKIDPSFDYEYVEDDLLPCGTYAYYDPSENKIYAANSVYERACAGVGRDRFTLAHEVGHYFLHRDGFSYARSNFDIPKYCDPEWQANTFASALLMPREKIVSMSVDEIQNTCKVSYQAAKIAFDCNWQ